MNGNKSAILVGVVANPPKICKVLGFKVVARNNLSIVGSVDIRSRHQFLCVFGSHGHKRAGNFHFNAILPLKLHHVFGAVVDIFAKVAVCGRCGKLDAAGSSADDAGHFSCGGVKTGQQNAGV